MPGAWPAVIREGVQAGVACQVARLQGDVAAGRVADQVVAERDEDPSTIGIVQIPSDLVVRYQAIDIVGVILSFIW
jgi:hypothetical protein